MIFHIVTIYHANRRCDTATCHLHAVDGRGATFFCIVYTCTRVGIYIIIPPPHIPSPVYRSLVANILSRYLRSPLCPRQIPQLPSCPLPGLQIPPCLLQVPQIPPCPLPDHQIPSCPVQVPQIPPCPVQVPQIPPCALQVLQIPPCPRQGSQTISGCWNCMNTMM